MSVLKFYNFNINNILNFRNLLCTRNILKCTEQQSFISSKSLNKLGIPLPPKKPLSPYLRFLQTVRPKIKENQPHLSSVEIIKVAAQEWAKCDADQKKLLQKDYLIDMEDYLIRSEEYKKNITPEQKNLIENTKQKKERAKERARIHEKTESLGKPKKPLTAFLKFMLEKKALKNDNIIYKEWIKNIAKEWENLSEQSKEKYKIAAKQEIENYKVELLAWEEKMIRQGHIDIVRNKDLLEDKSHDNK